MDKKFLIKFAGYWVVNSLVLGLANSFFMSYYVLGNAYLGIPAAAAISGFLITALLLIAKGLARSKYFLIKGRMMMFGYYWLAGSAAVWLTARVASISGFGIPRFTWAIVAGFAIALSNWLLRQAYKGIKLI